MLNYLRNFITNLSTITSPIRELLKKNVHFQWMPNHEKCLNDIKKQIIKAPVLANFDSNKETVIHPHGNKMHVKIYISMY